MSRVSSWGPLLLSLLAAALSVFLWLGLSRVEDGHVRLTLRADAERIAGELEARMEARILALSRMAARWEQAGGSTYAEFVFSAGLNMKDYPGFTAIEWAGPDGQVHWVVPERDAESLVGLDLRGEPRRAAALDQARQSGRPAVTEPVELAQGGRGVLVAVPLDEGEAFAGWVVGVFRFAQVLDRVLGPGTGDDYGLAIRREGRELIRMDAGSPALEARWSSEARVSLLDQVLTVRVWPNEATLDRLRSPMPGIALAAGLLVSAMLGMALYNARLARSRARALERTNRELRHEVAERRAAERKAEQAADELARSNRDLEQFAYAASHDLQEPLRLVGSYAQLLERRHGDRLDASASAYLGHVVAGVERMRRLIADLLAYARVGAETPRHRSADASVVLRDALSDLDARIRETAAEVTWDPLPSVAIDPGRLRQVFQNLVGNALKYHGDGAPRVHVSASPREGEWELSVADDGLGIDPAHHERIFDVFVRLHGREEFEGTGMGLALCKRIVEAHGGRLWVESRPEKGSVFRFTLPAAPPQQPAST